MATHDVAPPPTDVAPLETASTGEQAPPEESEELFPPRWQDRIRITTIYLLVAVGLATAAGFWCYWRDFSAVKTIQLENAENRGNFVLSFLEREIAHLTRRADGIAADLSSGKLEWKDVRARLQELLDGTPGLSGVGAVLDPASDPAGADVAPIFLNKYSEQTEEDPATLLRATANGPVWLEPRPSRVSYVTPFTGRIRGAISIDVWEPWLRKTLWDTPAGYNGYSFILSPTGTYISHTISEYLRNARNIRDVAREHEIPEFTQLSELLLNTDHGRLRRIDEVSGEPSIVGFRHMRSTHWIIAFNEITSAHPEWVYHWRVWLLAGASVFVTLLCIVLSGAYTGSSNGLWWTSTVWSFVCLAGIAMLWNIAVNSDDFGGQKVFHAPAKLRKFAREYSELSSARHYPVPVYIPTGIYIQSISFENNDVVDLTGYVWQQYDHTIPKTIRRGLFFADDKAELSLTESNSWYRKTDGDLTTIGWQFRVSLHQTFDFHKYPFDRQVVSVRLRPLDFNRNVILMPDVDSYDMMNPVSRPGFDHSFNLGGWAVKQCFFSCQMRNYNTDFGLHDFASQHRHPVLTYNMTLDRMWLSPALESLFPLLMISFTIFVNLMTFKRDDKAWGLYGTVAGLFLTSLLAHLKLRDLFSLHDIIYLEYFYLAVYAIIVMVAVNTYLYGVGTKNRIITYRDNLLPKTLYWPLMLTGLWLLTFIEFY